MKVCLEGKGYVVEVTHDGGVGVEYAKPDTAPDVLAKLKAAFDEAFGGCLHVTGYDRIPTIDPEEDYRQQTGVDDCLRANGIPVKSPTREGFANGQVSDRESVLPKVPDEYARLQALCHF